jgi:molecular chaperone GrpE
MKDNKTRRFNLSRTRAMGRSLLKEKMDKKKELEEEVELYKVTAKRIAAEFDNYRKRTKAEKERQIKEASERVIKKMIPFFESIDLALKNIKEKNKTGENKDRRDNDNESINHGIRLLHNQMRKVLVEEGVEFINQAHIEFNPKFHEAIQTKEDKKNAGKVLKVLQPGVKLHDKVLRPARVIAAVDEADSDEKK